MPIKKIPKNKKFTRILTKNVLIIITLIIITIGVYVFVKKDTSVILDDQNTLEDQELIQKDIDDLVQKVSTHYLLPTGEEPVVATVTDAQALSVEQEFYKDVENGDRVMLYIQNKRAINYSPSRDIIINVGPIISDEESVNPVEEQQEVIVDEE
jgi:hypothetical protein